MRRRQGEPSHTNTYRLKKMSSPLPRKVLPKCETPSRHTL